MRLDVFFGGQHLAPADVHGRVVLVIDVLRASTTVAVALANGARAVIPFESSDEVIARSSSSVKTSCWPASVACTRFPASTSATRHASTRRRKSKERPSYSRRLTARSRSLEYRAHVT